MYSPLIKPATISLSGVALHVFGGLQTLPLLLVILDTTVTPASASAQQLPVTRRPVVIALLSQPTRTLLLRDSANPLNAILLDEATADARTLLRSALRFRLLSAGTEPPSTFELDPGELRRAALFLTRLRTEPFRDYPRIGRARALTLYLRDAAP